MTGILTVIFQSIVFPSQPLDWHAMDQSKILKICTPALNLTQSSLCLCQSTVCGEHLPEPCGDSGKQWMDRGAGRFLKRPQVLTWERAYKFYPFTVAKATQGDVELALGQQSPTSSLYTHFLATQWLLWQLYSSYSFSWIRQLISSRIQLGANILRNVEEPTVRLAPSPDLPLQMSLPLPHVLRNSETPNISWFKPIYVWQQPSPAASPLLPCSHSLLFYKIQGWQPALQSVSPTKVDEKSTGPRVYNIFEKAEWPQS